MNGVFFNPAQIGMQVVEKSFFVIVTFPARTVGRSHWLNSPTFMRDERGQNGAERAKKIIF